MPTAAAVYLLLWICLSSVAVVHAQQPMPFLGRGDNPPASPVDVYVTAYLDRLLTVDDKEYAFSVGFLYLASLAGYSRGNME